jgi:hypothetical protein
MERLLSDSTVGRHAPVQVARTTTPQPRIRVPVVISGPGMAGPTLGPRAFSFDAGLAQHPGRVPIVVSGPARAVSTGPAADTHAQVDIGPRREIGSLKRPADRGLLVQPLRPTPFIFGPAQAVIDAD